MEKLGPLIAFLALFGLVGWIIWLVSKTRQSYHKLNLLNDFHNRLLDRIGSAKDFGDFLETEGGRSFLEALKSEPTPPRANRTLRWLQGGSIFLVLGGACLYLQPNFPEDDGFLVLGVLLSALGLGFLLSTLAGHFFGDRLERR